MPTITLTIQTMASNLDPKFSIFQDANELQKPLICVTPADDVVYKGSEDETCSSPGLLDVPYNEPLSEKSAMINTSTISKNPITNSEETNFSRTGSRNRAEEDQTSKRACHGLKDLDTDEVIAELRSKRSNGLHKGGKLVFYW